jgi:predicted phage terminase large subunit-like protein
MDMYIGVDIGVQADANKAREQDSDYWAAAVLAVDPVHGDGYLVDLRRQRGMTLREGLQWLDGIHREADRANIIIESNQSQRFFFQEAKEMGLPVSKTYNTDNKEDRLIQLSIPFGNETVQMLDWGDDRWQDFVNEWLAFPDGTHDDCLDAVQIAVENAPINSGQTQILSGDMYGQDNEDR